MSNPKMTPQETIEVIRSTVRPVLTYLYSLAIVILAVLLIWKFADRDLAYMFAGAVLGSGTTIMAFWFRDRMKTTVPPPTPPEQ